MVDAFKLAEGGDQNARSKELEKLHLIDRFGVKAVTGRDILGYKEMRFMYAAENIYNAKIANMNSDNWAEWARRNKQVAELLAKVEKMING